MNSSLQVLVAFAVGLATGIFIDAPALVGVAEPVGTIWINAIRMPIIPLVVALIVSGVATTGDTRRVGTLTLRAIGVFLALLALYAIVCSSLAPLLMSRLTLDAASTDALRASVSPSAVAVEGLTFASWLTSLVPVNPIRAAVDGALLPLVIFSLLYGLALTRVSDGARRAQVTFFKGIADTCIVLIRWVLALAPLGVFALALVLGARLGAQAAGAVVYYLIVDVLLLIACLALLYAITVVIGRVPLRTFATALLPAQMIAFSSRSSLAALPVLIEDARTRLRLPEQIVSVVLPLGASLFKLNSPITWPLGAALVAALYGVELDAARLFLFGVGSVLLSLTTPGIPSGGFFVQAPLYVAVGLPPEGIGILIAVDLIPDLFKTAINVTGYASAGLILSRQQRMAESTMQDGAEQPVLARESA